MRVKGGETNLGQELQHRGVLVETPPADATAR